MGKRSGQVMIMTTLTLGSVLLGATTVAGLLMVYQLRQSNDFANSVRAIAAADAGLEAALYAKYKGIIVYTKGTLPAASSMNLGSGAKVEIRCRDAVNAATDCEDAATTQIITIGTNAMSSRALAASF